MSKETLSLAESSELVTEHLKAELLEHEVLTEALIGPKRRTDRKTILRRAIARQAILIARAEGDPMFEKYKLHFLKMRELRSLIQKKYLSKARAAVMAAQRGDEK